MSRRRAVFLLKWTGTAAGIAGAALVAANVGHVVAGYILWSISAGLWTVAGVIIGETSLVVLQGVFFVIDLVGIWRWMFT